MHHLTHPVGAVRGPPSPPPAHNDTPLSTKPPSPVIPSTYLLSFRAQPKNLKPPVSHQRHATANQATIAKPAAHSTNMEDQSQPKGNTGTPMSVNVGPAGRRSVRVEVEVEGSPEDVWNAIATGPGVSSWFVPTKFDLDADSRPASLVCHFGEGMDSHATITGWAPPRRFTAESADFAPGGPVVATEWNVKPVRKETCLVTVEHSLISDTDEWDTFLENTESGWPAFFTVLRIRMAHFRSQPFAILEVVGKAAEPNESEVLPTPHASRKARPRRRPPLRPPHRRRQSTSPSASTYTAPTPLPPSNANNPCGGVGWRSTWRALPRIESATHCECGWRLSRPL